MRFIYLIVFALFIFSCNSNDDSNPPDDIPQGTDEAVNFKWEIETPLYLP